MFKVNLYRKKMIPAKASFWGLIAMFSFMAIFNFMSFSKNARAEEPLEMALRSSADSFFIGPYSFVTNRKPGSDYIESDIAQQHRESKLGKLQPSETIRIPTTYRQVWVTFAINNRTDNKNWIINFGNTIDGRLALVSKINIYNDTTKKLFEYATGQDGKFFGAAIPLKLEPQSRTLIVMMIEGERGFPLTLTPRLISEEGYIKSLLHTNIFSAILYVFFALVALAYVGFLFRTGKKEYFGFLSYYLILGTVYTTIDTTFQTPSIFVGEATVSLYVFSAIIAIFSVKNFLKITKNETPLENTLLLASLCGLISTLLIHLTILNQTDFGFFLINIAIAFTYAVLIFVSSLCGQKKTLPIQFFCAGLSFSFLGALIMCLISIYVLPANVIFLGLFWFTIPLQGTLIVYTHYESIRIQIENIEKQRVRGLHDTQAISKLQKNKESADQTRLLRIIERERTLLNNLREQEVHRTEEMAIAKIIAERANHAKSAFLAVVSHEIRTPMTGIMGMVQLLHDTNLSRTQAEYVDTIQKSGDTMMALLNDILDFEKIEHGSMRLENVPFDIRKLAQDIVLLMSGYASQRNLYLVANVSDDTPKAIYGDPTRLRQILLNLVGNGLKFTNEGGVTIQISYIFSEAGSTMVRFNITDTGIGITDAAQARLFTPFAQAEESTSRKYGGTGLGLAISSKLVEGMGGKIKITSEAGKGSTFHFSIPLIEFKGELSELPSRTSENKTYKTKPLRILVAEDNEINQKVLTGLLERDGHTVILAKNGHEALEMCKKHMPDLVLMDIQMDGLNGLDATKTLRADLNQKVSSIPIIAITGNVMPEDIEAYFAAQMNGFISKPIEASKLNRIIYNASLGKFENPVLVKNDQEKEVEKNLVRLKHNLELDENEIFSVPLQKNLPKKEDSELLSLKVDLSLDESDPNSIRRNKITDFELTEIQKFLKESHEATTQKQVINNKNPEEIAPPEPIKIAPQIFSTVQPLPHNPAASTGEIPKQRDPSPAIFGLSVPERKKEQNLPSKKPDSDRDFGILIDETMLESLTSALGKTQFSSLLSGFLIKSDEIIEEIESAVAAGNIKEIGIRAHDLKGMAGNFGMTALSNAAGEAEKSAKTGASETAIATAKTLAAICEKTKAALEQRAASENV